VDTDHVKVVISHTRSNV